MVLAAALAGGSAAQGTGASAPPTGAQALRPAADTGAFRHARHSTLKCEACHSTAESHGSLKVKTLADCRACHHSASVKDAGCATCHSPQRMVGAIPKPVEFAVSARSSGAVTRPLGFQHARHTGLDCSDCHAAGTTKAVETTCTSCHADHHDAVRDCASCHPSASTGHSRAATHDGCTSCHTGRRARNLELSRSMCVMCHTTQRAHYSGKECAECHAVAPPP